MQVKDLDINTRKIKGYGICKKKYTISFLGGPTTPTYSRHIKEAVSYFEILKILWGQH